MGVPAAELEEWFRDDLNDIARMLLACTEAEALELAGASSNHSTPADSIVIAQNLAKAIIDDKKIQHTALTGKAPEF